MQKANAAGKDHKRQLASDKPKCQQSASAMHKHRWWMNWTFRSFTFPPKKSLGSKAGDLKSSVELDSWVHCQAQPSRIWQATYLGLDNLPVDVIKMLTGTCFYCRFCSFSLFIFMWFMSARPLQRRRSSSFACVKYGDGCKEEKERKTWNKKQQLAIASNSSRFMSHFRVRLKDDSFRLGRIKIELCAGETGA